MSDYISRQAAIDEVTNMTDIMNDTAKGVLRERLRKLPPADVKPVKRGKWIAYYHGGTAFSYSCNQCLHSATERGNFCPNCGADMRGENDDR